MWEMIIISLFIVVSLMTNSNNVHGPTLANVTKIEEKHIMKGILKQPI